MSNIIYCGGKNQSFNHPAQTRRFPRYASRKKINFLNYYDNKSENGSVILNQSADFTFWKKNCHKYENLIFDANDPYLLPNQNSLKDKLRGLFKYVSGSHKYLEFNYQKTYEEMCINSDLVIVSHQNQYELLKSKVKRIALITDYSIKDNLLFKTNYSLKTKKTINIFWEGLGSSYLPFRDIENIFYKIKNEYNFIFHFSTDLFFYKIGDKFVKKDIRKIAKNYAPNFYKNFNFYQWTLDSVDIIANKCDLSIITLPLDYSMNYWKPNNKLVHMWRMGLPTIVSRIPSYQRLYQKTEYDLCASNIDEWHEKILKICEDEDFRREIGFELKKFTDKEFSNDSIDLKWEKELNFIYEN